MNERTENRIEGWDSKPLTGGFAELDELADGGFSGVARTRGTTLYMLNGRVVGVFGGSIDDFADAEATAYQAPHPSLPLLFAMKEYGGEQQAKYYTNDTPISEAHQQLSDAQFTGYVELSENVLSGDYYVVYYGGRSMSCAFVGNSGRLEVGDDAFELADDEVGIYEVMSVDVEVTDIPAAGSGTGGGPDAPRDSEDGESPRDPEPAVDGPEPDPTGGRGDTDPDAGRQGTAGDGVERNPDPGRTGADAEPAPGGADREPDRRSTAESEPQGGTGGGTGTRPDDGAGAGAGRGDDRRTVDSDPGEADPSRADRQAGDGSQAGGGATGSSGSMDSPGDAPSGTTGSTGRADPDGSADVDGQRESTGRSESAGRTESTGTSDPDGASEPAGTSEPTGSSRGQTDPRSRETAESRADTADASDARTGEPTGTADERTGNSTETAPTDGDVGTDERADAAADRAVEAASGPHGSSATGAATTSEGVPKSEATIGELRPIPSLSPDQTAVADPGDERGAGTDGDESGSAAAGDADAASGGGRGSRRGDQEVGANGGTTDVGRSGSSAASESGPADSTGTGAANAGTGTSNASTGTRDAGTGRASTGGTDVTERATREVDVETAAEPEPVPGDAGSAELREELRAREERIEELEAAITDLRVQRDGLTDERDRLESEVQRLETEVNDLESEVERLQSRLKDGTEGKQRLSPEDALAGTNLFIRYDSKSGGTLDKAHGGNVGREEVNNNLRIEHHTQFDADEVVVADDPFDEFLRGTIHRGFVEWVVRDLLYEIQDTGHVKALSDLYDAIPRIDRAELLGDVSVQYTEDGEQYREQRSFDVVLRDRMGNPLIVANLNDSRNPADREMMETVINNGIDVKESNESLGSAMMVTSSFFKPGALEAADESAGGGLLSRDAKRSYVKVNRKMGYHLVLVESRDGDFHVNVPEL